MKVSLKITVAITVAPETLVSTKLQATATVATVDTVNNETFLDKTEKRNKGNQEKNVTNSCGVSSKNNGSRKTFKVDPQNNGSNGSTTPSKPYTVGVSAATYGSTVSENNGSDNERIGVSAATDNGSPLENLEVGAKIHCYPTQESKEQNREVLATIEKIDTSRKLLEISWGDCKGFIGLERVVGIVPVPKWYEI